MTTWILLLRGINVGGKNRLPMNLLRQHLEVLHLRHVKTYIQSGNAVFQASHKNVATLRTQLSSIIEQHYGFRPDVFVLSIEQFERAIASNPFPEGEAAPQTLHLFFLASSPAAPDVSSLAAVKAPSERFHLSDRVFYLHAPEGIGRSKLAAKVEKCLGVPLTARNWRTVQQLWALAHE